MSRYRCFDCCDPFAHSAVSFRILFHSPLTKVVRLNHAPLGLVYAVCAIMIIHDDSCVYFSFICVNLYPSHIKQNPGYRTFAECLISISLTLFVNPIPRIQVIHFVYHYIESHKVHTDLSDFGSRNDALACASRSALASLCLLPSTS